MHAGQQNIRLKNEKSRNLGVTGSVIVEEFDISNPIINKEFSQQWYYILLT
jgi:hypothetical protein